MQGLDVGDGAGQVVERLLRLFLRRMSLLQRFKLRFDLARITSIDDKGVLGQHRRAFCGDLGKAAFHKDLFAPVTQRHIDDTRPQRCYASLMVNENRESHPRYQARTT